MLPVLEMPFVVVRPNTLRVLLKVVAPVTSRVPPTVALLLTVNVSVVMLPVLEMPFVVVRPVTSRLPPTVSLLLIVNVSVVMLPVLEMPFCCCKTCYVKSAAESGSSGNTECAAQSGSSCDIKGAA